MTGQTVLLVLLGTCCAGFVSGLAGFAFGLISLSIWVWSLDPHLLAPMVVFGSLIAQLVAFGAMRRSLDWRRLLPFVGGGAIGVPVGVLLLHSIDVATFRATVGLVLVFYCSAMLLVAQLPPIRFGGQLADAAIGLIGGTMGGLAGLSGPAPTLWCNLRGWERDVQRGIFQTFNLAMHAITLTVYGLSGALDGAMLQMFALMLPAVLLPTWLGMQLYRRLSDTLFRRLILGLLLLSGAVLLGTTLLR